MRASILLAAALTLTACHVHHSSNPRRVSSDHGQWQPTFKHRYVPTAKDYLNGLA